MHFDLLVDLVVFADQLFDRVLFDHVEDVALGVEVGGVDVHQGKDLNFFLYYYMWGLVCMMNVIIQLGYFIDLQIDNP